MFELLHRPHKEKELAEKFGIGVVAGSTFTLNEQSRDDIQKMCLPNIGQKQMKGIITHVSHVHLLQILGNHQLNSMTNIRFWHF